MDIVEVISNGTIALSIAVPAVVVIVSAIVLRQTN